MRSIACVFQEYMDALRESDEERANTVILSALDGGISAEDLLMEVVMPSITRINQSMVIDGEINLAQHYLTSKISEKTSVLLLDKFATRDEPAGCVIMGTSVGDHHALGKKIVCGCLRANLFNVIDAGCNITAEQFVDTAMENHAQVIGISSMMAHTATGSDACLGVRKILKERNLENRIKIMVGGAPYRFDHELYKQVEADDWGENGIAAVEAARRLVSQTQMTEVNI